MYKVTMDGAPLAISNAEELSLLNPVVRLEANKAGTFSFIILPDHPSYETFALRQSMIDVWLNDELIFEGVPVSEEVDFWNRKSILCEGELTFLNDSIQRQAVYRNQTAQTLLAEYLTNHNAQADASHQFDVGIVTVDGGNGIYRFTNYANTMTEINEDLVKDFGGYLRVRHADGVRYLDYLEESPRTSSQVIRIGRNLLELTKNLTTDDLCTVLIPLGARTGEQLIDGLEERLTIEEVNGGLDYIVAASADTYGKIWRTVTWDEVTTPSALLTKAQTWLESGQYANMVIEATALDLGLSNEAVEQFRILDMIRVVSSPHGLDTYMMLTKLEIDLDHLANTQITLGSDEKVGISAKTSQVSQSLTDVTTTISVSAAENARHILETATSGNIYFVYDENGVISEMLIMDTNSPETAQKIWRWNINGWGYSNDGGQTYSVAATMDGSINADLINAGTLNGIRVITESGNIGGWEIGDQALYKDVKASDGYVYRIYFQPTQDGDVKTWILSCQKSTTQGEVGDELTFTPSFILFADGTAQFNDTLIDVDAVNIGGDLTHESKWTWHVAADNHLSLKYNG